LNIFNANNGGGCAKAFRILKEIDNEAIDNIILADKTKTFPNFVKLNTMINNLTEEQKSKIICTISL